MKTIYKCELCGHSSENIDEIKKCEAQGIPNLEEMFPLNVIFQKQSYENITFLTREANIFPTSKHLYQVSGYATRDNGHGDNLGVMYSEPHLYKGFFFNEYHSVYDFESDHFRRMVKWLVDNNLPVKYWNGKEICEFEVPSDFFNKPSLKPIYFRCRYSMYINRRGLDSHTSGYDIIDAIKTRNQNSILVSITDVDGTEYVCMEHEPDDRGYFNYYWVNKKTGEILYDEGGPIKKENKIEDKKEEEDDFIFEIPLEDGEERYEDELVFEEFDELPDVIPVDYGVGIKFKDDKGKEYESISQGERKVTLRITSYRGISFGAI